MMSGIAVLGGTFDPVHYGHLRSAVAVRDELSVQEVRMIPSLSPPHRDPPESSADHRVAMLHAAVAGEPGIVVDEREVYRDGPSYTVDTLRSLRSEVGADTSIYFVMGADAFYTLDQWYKWQEIIELSHIVVLKRPGFPLEIPDEMQPWMNDKVVVAGASLSDRDYGNVVFLALEQVPVSSTLVRRAIHQGDSTDEMLPTSVIQYIRCNSLYEQGFSNAER